MANAKRKQDEGFFAVMRNLRDIGVDAWAQATVQVTGSSAYQRMQMLASQPGLIARGLVRKSMDARMTQLLGQLSLPSRGEVLSLSTRLTHIETVLDDLGALLEGMQARTARPPARAGRAAVRAVGES